MKGSALRIVLLWLGCTLLCILPAALSFGIRNLTLSRLLLARYLVISFLCVSFNARIAVLNPLFFLWLFSFVHVGGRCWEVWDSLRCVSAQGSEKG